jgi:hypothetical protein
MRVRAVAVDRESFFRTVSDLLGPADVAATVILNTLEQIKRLPDPHVGDTADRIRRDWISLLGGPERAPRNQRAVTAAWPARRP